MEARLSSHGAYQLQYHVVWVCKYRRRILNPGVCGYLRRIFPKLLRSMPGVEMETITPFRSLISPRLAGNTRLVCEYARALARSS